MKLVHLIYLDITLFPLGIQLVQGGGLLIYICDSYQIKTLNIDQSKWLWECLICKISSDRLKHEIILANIYLNINPPRKYTDLEIFINEYIL